MNHDDLLQWLAGWFAAIPDALMMIEGALVQVADAAGRGPLDPNYQPTYDQWLTAAAVAEMLALKGSMAPSAGTLKQISSEGTTMQFDAAAPVNWWEVAALLRGRSPLMQAIPAGIGVLQVEQLPHFHPRSGGVL